MTTALAGIRVLDLADRSAALAGRVLADLGAEVIMVEPPGGNSIRRLEPRFDGVDRAEASFAHQYFSANKRSVVLDIADEPDRRRFLGLVASADVVIDTERPGMLDQLGLGHDSLRAVQPGLVQCSVTPFGLDGEWRDRKATDVVAGAAGGLIWLSGESRGTPVQGGADVTYAMAGLIAASAISIALHQRDHSGQGSGAHIDISLQEAAATAAMQTATPSQWTWFNRIPRRPGLSAALRCADGGHVGHLLRPDRFDEFLAWLDREGIEHEMTSDDWHYSRLDAPFKNNPVHDATRHLAAKLSRDEFFAGALVADVVCLPVLSFEDHERIDQYIINEQFLEVEHPAIDRTLGFVRSPVDGMAESVELRPAPLLGADQSLLDEPASEPSSATPAVAPAVSSPDPSRALEGLRVVDFGWVLAAPIGTRLLASFGAEVVRIESTKKPDSMRTQVGPDGKPDPDLGGLFNVVNAGKKSLAVDLTTDEGMSLVRDLIAGADVVVNNFRPGAMDRMGFGFDVLRALNPRVVSLNLPGAHPKGPWAVRPSMGNILMAASGFNMLTGFEGEKPRGIGIAYPDFTGPHLLTAAILGAVRQRDTIGAQEMHLTQLTGMISLLGAEWMQYKATGVQPPRRANRDPNLCPHGVFPALSSERSDDEWVALAVDGDAEWVSFCEAIGRSDLATDERFVTHAARKEHEDDLDEILASWSRELDKWEIADRLQAAGIAAAPVEHLDEMIERDPQLRHRYQYVQQPTRPDVDIPVDREAARWVGHDLMLTRAPGVGEHNQHVVCDLLGRTEEEYVQLILADVLT